MGDIIGGSTNANQPTTTGSGNAKIITGGGAQYTESGAISVGKRGKYQESGSYDLTNAKNLGNTTITAKGNISLGDGGAAVADVAKSFSDTLSQITQSNNAALSSALTGQSTGTNQAAGSSSPSAGSPRLALIIAGVIVLLFLGMMFWRRNK